MGYALQTGAYKSGPLILAAAVLGCIQLYFCLCGQCKAASTCFKYKPEPAELAPVLFSNSQ